MTLVVLAFATPLAAQEAEPRVELLIEAPSSAAVDRGVAGFRVEEDGQPVSGLTLAPRARDWRIVVVFDQVLSGPLVVKSAALELAGLAENLVALGPVEVVTASDEVALSLPSTQDAEALEQALSWIAVREGGAEAQLEVRRRFLASEAMAGLAENEYSGVSATAGRRIADLSATVREAVEAELVELERQRLGLVEWLAETSAPGPKLLILASGGWDESPLDFYQRALRRVKMNDVAEGLVAREPRPGVDAMARVLSSLGWSTVAFTPSRLVDPETANAEGDRSEPEGSDRVETVYQDGREVDRTMLGTIDPRDLLKRLGGKGLTAELVAPAAPLALLASATGGRPAADGRQISGALEDYESRLLLTYPIPEGAPRGDWRRVAVRAAGGQELRARRWVTADRPEVLAETRALRLMAEDVEEGDLTVSARYVDSEGVVNVDLATPAGMAAPSDRLRVTLATASGEDQPEVSHRLVGADDLRPIDDLEGVVAFALPSTAAADPDTVAIVLVEDLESGAWGSGFVRVGGAEGYASVPGTGSFVLPAPKVIHLLAPTEPVAMGPTTFDTVVSDDRVSRVDFYLDEALALSRTSRPFAARLDLGRLPRPRRVQAIAFGPGGGELGRDSLTVNEGTGNFKVRIVSPGPEETGAPSRPRLGGVEVEADLRLPGGAELERLEFYWKETLVGTRFAPPYVQRVTVPSEDSTGFLRVVGYLEDGASAEDVVFINSPGGSEDLRVELVELYTVVTDRRGRPIRGLGEGDFRVVEDGVEQEIATFSDAGERPLTVGLAIDSSASMFVKLPEVQLAASSFLTGLRTRRDRAFVVGFGDEPFLQRDTTSDLPAVRAAVAELEPEGRTSIWKGIVYSLVQLQGVPGKKALIVFSDGADEDPEFSFRTSLDFARRVGVPVYIVVSNDEIFRTQGKGLTIRGFMNRLESLTRAVGGRVFVTRVGEDLEAIYRDIDEELRSQYLLGYYAADREGEDWRPVDVEVDRAGARARTISGYYQ